MLGSLMADGLEITNEPSEADALIVNTCSFIDSAQEESVDTILESAEYREAQRPGQALIVSGCLPQRFRNELPKLMPEVDAFMGVDQIAEVSRIVREAIAAKPYVYGAHHLPHDVMVRELGAGGRSRFETLGGLGVQPIEVGRAVHPEERVNAGRLMIPSTWFDAEKCAAGRERLRAYRKRWNAATHSYAGPLHDAASHGAYAFGEFALNRRGAPERRPARRGGGGEAGSWMG